MIENWKDIPGYFGFQVSDTNKVRRLAHTYTDAIGRVNNIRQFEIKSTINKKGYRRVELCLGKGKKKAMTLHRCVMLAFKGTPPEGMDQINHIDGNKDNNHPDNLEWSNNSHNIKHAWQTGLFNPNLPKGINSHKAKILIHTEYGYFCTIIEAAAEARINRKTLSDMVYNKIKNTTKYLLS